MLIVQNLLLVRLGRAQKILAIRGKGRLFSVAAKALGLEGGPSCLLPEAKYFLLEPIEPTQLGVGGLGGR
jgi:hypothetical protein